MTFGSDLDEIIRLPEIEGLTKGKPRYQATYITHYHGDHYSRVNEILPEIPVYMSNVAKQIIESVFCLSNTKGKFTRPIINIESGKTIQIKDIKVTAINVDHSAYGAFAYLIECEGKKVLHTRRYKTVIGFGPSIKEALKGIYDIDLLITERHNFFTTSNKGSNRSRTSPRNDRNNKGLRTSFASLLN